MLILGFVHLWLCVHPVYRLIKYKLAYHKHKSYQNSDHSTWDDTQHSTDKQAGFIFQGLRPYAACQNSTDVRI